MFVVSIALLLSFITMTIKIPKWNDDNNHKWFLLKILLLYQNSIVRISALYSMVMISFWCIVVIPSFDTMSPNDKDDKALAMQIYKIADVKKIVRRSNGINIYFDSKVVEMKELSMEETKKLRYLQEIRRLG